jgi:hypothetical protein
VQLEGLGKLITFNYFSGSRIHNLPTCSVVPQSLRYYMPTALVTTDYYILQCINCVHKESVMNAYSNSDHESVTYKYKDGTRGTFRFKPLPSVLVSVFLKSGEGAPLCRNTTIQSNKITQ